MHLLSLVLHRVPSVKDTSLYRTQREEVSLLWQILIHIKNTHKEKTLSKKTQALTRRMNIDIRVIGTLSQLFKRRSYTQAKFSKK